MSVTLKTRQVGDVTIIDVSGRITLGEGSIAVRAEMHRLTASGTKKILLNLADVPYVDTSGIGELVGGLASVAKAGGRMKLLNPTRRVQDLLRITNLNAIFDVDDDESHAVQTFT